MNIYQWRPFALCAPDNGMKLTALHAPAEAER
jgi:hypothetical protein